MGWLSFLADEHVPNVVVTALRANGYRVDTAKEHHGEGTVDSELLADAAVRGLALLTNDRDFVRHATDLQHAGVVIYVTPQLPPGEFVRAADRIDDQYTPNAMLNNVEWLEDWLRGR